MEYHLEVSAKPDMSSPIINETGLSQLSYTVPKETLGTGEFYWRVTAGKRRWNSGGGHE